MQYSHADSTETRTSDEDGEEEAKEQREDGEKEWQLPLTTIDNTASEKTWNLKHQSFTKPPSRTNISEHFGFYK